MKTATLYPVREKQQLTEEEIESPLLVIENFFDFVHAWEAREFLWQVFDMMVKKNYPYTPGSIQHDDMTYFFEKMEKLIDAVHILHLRETASLY